MSNIWNDDDDDAPSEYELLEEAKESENIAAAIESTPHEIYDFSEIEDSIIEEIREESAFELDEEEVSSVYNVRVRLEQCKLYEMLINHNLFEGVEASPQAISNVQTELKDYIIERMELLMGLRQPKSEIREEIIIDQPFNDVEIDFLKALSYKGTQGASAGGEYIQPEIRRVTSEISPVTQKKSQSLKPLVSRPNPKPAPIVREEPLRAKPKAPTKAPTRKAPAPTAKTKPKTNNRPVTQVEMIKGEVKMSPAQAEKIARDEIKKEQAIKKARGGKDWGKMKAAEKAAEIRRANERNARPKPVNTLPMPDQNAINTHYQTQEAVRGGKRGGRGDFNLMLANTIANQKITNGDYDE